ncbi:MAG: isocitrate dehydrogenase (NADP(+)) [Candidatus Diapherotrites archaeon]|uniref:Isocitrate dehydrogenase (NADP(+)) n=1 Tax=Candidatus Iainarchaeum sp. TaxID=3101447 RepID=A0A8T4L7V1_9ARCH|nr:isocitrate dehydrogenase (NADP(+)) [Candidatus Diapherotrites archaeon]
MGLFKIYPEPKEGQKIEMKKGKLWVPDKPIIPVIYGDGSGPDCSKNGITVLDAAVKKAYGGRKKIVWFPVEAGQEAFNKRGEWMPTDTTTAIKHYLVSIKGPLETPVGGGHRSLNVALRQECDLYCCVRPVQWFEGVPNPVKEPEKLDVVVFRENTEDVYAGIEWKQGTPEAQKMIAFLATQMGKKVRADSGIGVKPMSATGSKRLIRAAIKYAIANKRRSVTMMHKGNIMKFTEGAFREWGYEVAKEFGDQVVTEQEIAEKFGGQKPEGKVLVNDRIADSMFQQILLRPGEYDVIATPNLNGDYISDAAAAQVGGLGIAPGGNINYDTGLAVFEATHGTAPKYAGQDKVNPGSFILSGVMMLEYLGWKEAAALVNRGFAGAIKAKRVTYDFARQMEGAEEVKSSEFAQEIIKHM